jgi:hypothetical protein
MSENQPPNHDLLDEAIQAFQQMRVPERPLDAQVLARFSPGPPRLSRKSRIPLPANKRYFTSAVLTSSAAAVLLLGGLALFSRNRSAPDSLQVAGTAAPDQGGDEAIQPPHENRPSQRESLGRHGFAKDVAAAEVIVVATALDAAPAPPKKPGDIPETLIRFRVKRVLKGKLDEKEITTRTPTAAGEFIGNDWIILLSPDYLAGKYQYASHINIKLEPTVKAMLDKDKK